MGFCNASKAIVFSGIIALLFSFGLGSASADDSSALLEACDFDKNGIISGDEVMCELDWDIEGLDKRIEELDRKDEELDRKAEELDREYEESRRRTEESRRRTEKLKQILDLLGE